MEKERAIINMRDKLNSLIPTINEFYWMFFDDYVKNGQDCRIFQKEFYSIDEDFKDFEFAAYSLTELEFRKFDSLLMQIKEVSEKYIENYKTRFYPGLSFLIDDLIKKPSPIVYRREDFLNTNRVKILFDYCEKVNQHLTSLLLTYSENYKSDKNINRTLIVGDKLPELKGFFLDVCDDLIDKIEWAQFSNHFYQPYVTTAKLNYIKGTTVDFGHFISLLKTVICYDEINENYNQWISDHFTCKGKILSKKNVANYKSKAKTKDERKIQYENRINKAFKILQNPKTSQKSSIETSYMSK